MSLTVSVRYKLRVEVTNRKMGTTKSQADIQEKRASLMRQIHNWRKTQLIYTPHAAILIAANLTLDENGVPRTENAENVPLYLPSSLPADVVRTEEMKRICNMELRLRKASANDALFEIRRGRRNVTKLWKHKKANVSGTGNRPNTRMLTMYTRLDNKINRAADKYRRARKAIQALQPDDPWLNEFQELRREDIRGPGIDPDDTKTSKGRFEESWIWIVQRKGKNAKTEEQEYKDDMRVDWVKSRARIMRWKEEVLLIQEEMRRVIVWFEWKACWWEGQGTLRTDASEEVLGGIRAYAYKQAAIIRRMATLCVWEWTAVLKSTLGVEPEWASRYPPRPAKRKNDKRKGIPGSEGQGSDGEGSDGEGSEGESSNDGDDDENPPNNEQNAMENGEVEHDMFDDFEFDD